MSTKYTFCLWSLKSTAAILAELKVPDKALENPRIKTSLPFLNSFSIN